MKTLKIALHSWRELLFIFPMGILLIEITKSVILRQNMDKWDIFTVCIIAPFLICLIGQLFWKSKSLSIVLSALLVLSSTVFILMALYFLCTTSTQIIQAIVMLMLGISFFVAAITMPVRYYP